MKDTELLTLFEIHKQGTIRINHSPHERVFPTSMTFEDFYRMIKLKIEKESNEVHMD